MWACGTPAPYYILGRVNCRVQTLLSSANLLPLTVGLKAAEGGYAHICWRPATSDVHCTYYVVLNVEFRKLTGHRQATVGAQRRASGPFCLPLRAPLTRYARCTGRMTPERPTSVMRGAGGRDAGACCAQPLLPCMSRSETGGGDSDSKQRLWRLSLAIALTFCSLKATRDRSMSAGSLHSDGLKVLFAVRIVLSPGGGEGNAGRRAAR